MRQPPTFRLLTRTFHHTTIKKELLLKATLFDIWVYLKGLFYLIF